MFSLTDNSLVVTAIVLRTVYGVISRCCHVDGREIDEYTEVVFRPDLLLEHDCLKGWATAIGRVVAGTILYEDWNGFVYEAVLGIDFGMLHATAQRSGQQNQRKVKVELLVHGRTILGCQANDLAAVTAMAIELSILPACLLQIFLHRGQILS